MLRLNNFFVEICPAAQLAPVVLGSDLDSDYKYTSLFRHGRESSYKAEMEKEKSCCAKVVLIAPRRWYQLLRLTDALFTCIKVRTCASKICNLMP